MPQIMRTVKLTEVNPHVGYIGYFVSENIGLAILTRHADPRHYGFRYALSLTNEGLKFASRDPKESIAAALRSGRKVFWCNHWWEALEFALDCRKHRTLYEVLDLRTLNPEP